MKQLMALNAVFLCFALNLAFAGGGSEVGDGHGSRASVPMPHPTPSFPGGSPRHLPPFDVVSVQYSASELRAGETLTVTIVANAMPSAPQGGHCSAVLKSEELAGISIPVQLCKVSLREDAKYEVVLEQQFPARTPSREYYVSELTVNRAPVPLIAAKRFHVHGSRELVDLDLTDTVLTTQSGTAAVKHGEDFFMDATFRTDGPIVKIMLAYALDQGAGLEPKLLSLTADAGFMQKQQDGSTLVRIPLMSELDNVRHMELRRVTVLNAAFQSTSFVLPQSFVVDFE